MNKETLNKAEILYKDIVYLERQIEALQEERNEFLLEIRKPNGGFVGKPAITPEQKEKIKELLFSYLSFNLKIKQEQFNLL